MINAIVNMSLRHRLVVIFFVVHSGSAIDSLMHDLPPSTFNALTQERHKTPPAGMPGWSWETVQT